jgi:hypothetical protein
MDEERRRRLSIARELTTWGTAMPALMARIAQALKMPSLPGRQKLDLETLARRITTRSTLSEKRPMPRRAMQRSTTN